MTKRRIRCKCGQLAANYHGYKEGWVKCSVTCSNAIKCKWCKTEIKDITKEVSIRTCKKCLKIPYVYKKIFGHFEGCDSGRKIHRGQQS